MCWAPRRCCWALGARAVPTPARGVPEASALPCPRWAGEAAPGHEEKGRAPQGSGWSARVGVLRGTITALRPRRLSGQKWPKQELAARLRSPALSRLRLSCF